MESAQIFRKIMKIYVNHEKYEKAIQTYRKNTLGSDLWGLTELKKLPSVLSKKFSKILNKSVIDIASPHQLLLNLNACLGKPNGDSRTITKTPMLYRMVMRANDEIRQWELENKEPFDTATIGSSALIAALLRNLKAEIAANLGKFSIAVFNDFEKFFDSLDIKTLLEEALETEFPTTLLSFLLQQHLAPRIIQANGFSSDPLNVYKSIIAGCKSSVALTRVYLKRAIAHIDKRYPEANTKVFVDDTCMQSCSKGFDKTLQKVVPAVSMFGDKAKLLNLKLSPKATTTASSNKLAKQFKKEMYQEYKMTFQIDESSRDVGVTHTAAKIRAKKIIKTRFNKRSNKINRIEKVAKICKSAGRKLFSGSAFASSTWGHEASGLAHSEILMLERDALKATGTKSAGRCKTTALICAYGVLGTPKARVVRETIRAWFKILRICKGKMMNQLKQAWPKQLKTMLNNNHIKNVKGIMSNVMYILLKAKWFPTSVIEWKDANGATWSMGGTKVSPDIVAAAIIKDLLLIDLQRAADHYNGLGLQNGIHYNATSALLRKFKHKDHAYTSLLETIISGATWPASRINEIQLEFSPKCPRCGAETEDAFHCYWDCPANDNIQDTRVADTQYLCKAAKFNVQNEPCLWLRGILPDNHISIPPEEEPIEETTLTKINSFDTIESGIYYGDASGGTYTKYPEIRRVGCSFVKCDSEGNLLYGCHFPLPGDIQTVARGELFAVVELVRFAEPMSELFYVTDNQGVFTTFNAGPKHSCLSSNADLYHELFRLTVVKFIKLHIRWMPAHLKEDSVLPDGVTLTDVKSNDHADKYAKLAAKGVSVSNNTARKCIYKYNLVRKIQNRIAAIIQHLPDRKRLMTVKTAKETKDTLDMLAKQSSHTLTLSGDRYTCNCCKNSYSTKDKVKLQEWLATQCEALPSSTKPSNIDKAQVHLGNLNIHSSHKKRIHRGLVFCRRCGSRAGTKIQNLAAPCRPPGKYGRDSLNAILNDRLPPNLTSWPDSFQPCFST